MQTKTIGQKKSFFGKSIVGYLDLLGFSNTILKDWNNSERNPLDTILSLKRIITDNGNTAGLVLNLHDQEKSKKIEYVCNIKTVSDSIIINVPIEEGMTISDMFFSVIEMINSIFRLWGMCLESGYTVRGGIDFGDIYWDENEIIGPAFINAYLIESNIARTSRIVCSEKFVYLISDICGKIGLMSTMLLEGFIFDVDGVLCLNPHLLYDDPSGKEHFISIINRLMKGKPQYIKQKYIPLQKMLINKEFLHVATLDDLKQYICGYEN